MSLSQHLGLSVCDVLAGFHALIGCDYTNQFYGRFKYGSFKIMQRKKEMINKLSSLDQEQKLLLEIRVTLCFLSKKKREKRKFSDTNRLPPDESTLKMKIKITYYVTQGILNFLLSLHIFHLN